MDEGDPRKQPFPFSDSANCKLLEVGVGVLDDLLGDAWKAAAAAAAAAAVARAATELAPSAAVRAVC